MAPAVPTNSAGLCYSPSLDSLFLGHGWLGWNESFSQSRDETAALGTYLPFLVDWEYLLSYSFSKNPRIAFHQLGLYDCLILNQFMVSPEGTVGGVCAALPSHGQRVGPQKKFEYYSSLKGEGALGAA